MTRIPTSGYRSKSLFVDITLGVTDGLDSTLWCFAFASVIFTGALTVFLPLGVLSPLLGWALLSIVVAVTTRASLHMANIDEQGVVIIATIGALMVSDFGADASGAHGLATLLAIMMISSLGVAACCWLVGHYNVSRLLELLPYPVVCGFMAGIGWLLLDAGVMVATDLSISTSLPAELADSDRLQNLLLALICGFGLTLAVNRIQRSWSMPVASILIVIGFYLVVTVTGISIPELLAQGWLFKIEESDGSAFGILATLSPGDIDLRFVASVIPEILTIIFLVLLSSSMSLTALKAASRTDLNTAEEFKNVSGGNLLCGLVGCPPGYTDVIASTLYEEFGASSRWMPLVSSAVCLIIAVMGGWIIAYIPKLLVAATVFLFAFQTLYEWMFHNVRTFGIMDYAIVCTILGTVIFAGFMEGMGVGVILTVLLFVLRYSMISAIQGQHSLREHRSSVERSRSSNRALNTFVQIKKIRAPANVLLLYSAVSKDLAPKFRGLDAISVVDGEKLLFEETDFALEYLEELLLNKLKTGPRNLGIRDHLVDIVSDEDKVEILVKAMTRVECHKDKTLFEQGDLDTALYVVESGSLSAHIKLKPGVTKRVRKFRPGSLIGELSAYLSNNKRTARVVADEDSVLYRLSSENMARLDQNDLRLAVCIHELVAKTLAERITYMNRRLVVEFM